MVLTTLALRAREARGADAAELKEFREAGAPVRTRIAGTGV